MTKSVRMSSHCHCRSHCDLVLCHLVRHSVGDSSRCLVSHNLRCSCGGSVGDNLLLWDGVGRSCSIGQSRLKVSCCILSRLSCILVLGVNRCCCNLHRGNCLRHWVDVAVLVEVLGEALEVDGGEAAGGLDEVSMGGGEWTKLGTLVDKALKGETEDGREERGQDQLEISNIFLGPQNSLYM